MQTHASLRSLRQPPPFLLARSPIANKVVLLRNLSGPQLLEALARLSKYVKDTTTAPEKVNVCSNRHEIMLCVGQEARVLATEEPHSGLWTVYAEEAIKRHYLGGAVQNYL